MNTLEKVTISVAALGAAVFGGMAWSDHDKADTRGLAEVYAHKYHDRSVDRSLEGIGILIGGAALFLVEDGVAQARNKPLSRR